MADKNVPSEETAKEEKNTTLKEMETKPKKARKPVNLGLLRELLQQLLLQSLLFS